MYVGGWMREVAETIRLCTPVMDMLSASTMFGVLAVTDDDHRLICQLVHALLTSTATISMNFYECLKFTNIPQI